jgi:hypothetical protein
MAEDYGEQHTFSSGITCTILPFPALIFEKIQKLALKNFPEPKPPKKKIKVVDGEEIIDDITNEKYVAKKETCDAERNRWLSERILNIALRDCILLDLDEYEPTIAQLEKELGEEYPTDPIERKLEFVRDYVFRSGADFLSIVKVTQRLMTISSEEVSMQVDEIFPSEMAQSTGNGAETSGTTEVQPLDI